MDNLYAANICQTPKAWANTKTWQETCSKSNADTQTSHNDLLIPSAIVILPIFMLVSILVTRKLRRHYHRQQQRNRAFARLQKVALLERMLSIKVK
ncbi:MAG: hypothetical protein N4J56_001193 [Chroococcidiopsis sp. SAG 2025]|uniref:hypothetical protein n=1 Tax=Chroococcidiopsis sp. SAG 2025 TaxID=171389 RepID=UPI002936E76A|nr:hypothetical protein [Chroococcidiopsis sp. SAG 2025]MDV2991539.1 hypothetical protein [Chroococcidiopsis sp. SAG 2025]